MFYFNAVKRASMWSMPEELEDNQQVAKVIDEPPWGKSECLFSLFFFFFFFWVERLWLKEAVCVFKVRLGGG